MNVHPSLAGPAQFYCTCPGGNEKFGHCPSAKEKAQVFKSVVKMIDTKYRDKTIMGE
jgi:hypothetical protein